jgi:hypothetical protein
MGRVVALRCIRCGREYPPGDRVTGCEPCRAEGLSPNLAPEYGPAAGKGDIFGPRSPGIGRWAGLLPVEDPVSLGEGGEHPCFTPRGWAAKSAWGAFT